MRPAILPAAGALVLTSIGAGAELPEWELTGHVGLDTRAFREDARYAGQDGGPDGSLRAQPELYWRSQDGRQRVAIVAFGRLDARDHERSHLDLREAHWGFEGDGWDIKAGIGKVFWGVAESRHLVDVINQTDLVEDIDSEDKLGQPMLNLNVQRDYGRFGLYVMPRFRERTFPGIEGRLRFELPVDTERAFYESADAELHRDVAVRYSHYFGDVDLGAYLFDGTSREPYFVVVDEGDRIVPVYAQMTQVGVDLQYTRDAWLWKLEAIRRETRDDTFSAAVAGFEYTFYGVRGGAADLGVLLEYLYDGRAADAPPTPFDDDVFVGARLALNDSNDTSILAGAIVDASTHETFFNLEAERRFGDSVTVDLRLRAFANAAAGDALAPLERDDYLQLSVSWYY